jgi:hypothetical protein
MGPCRIIAVDNDLIPPGMEIQKPAKIIRIRFKGKGLDGSPTAALSYEPGASSGHIWMVDRRRNRDCKGVWKAENDDSYSWFIRCEDGLFAEGVLTHPGKGTGFGFGIYNGERRVEFIF